MTKIPGNSAARYTRYPDALIGVPKGHYAVAVGPVRDIGVVYAKVEPREAAVFLVQSPAHSHLKVVAGHIDDFCKDNVRVRTMLLRFGSRPQNVHAVLVVHEVAPPGFGDVVDVLQTAGITIRERFSRSPVIEHGVSLLDGVVSTVDRAKDLAEYRPNGERSRLALLHLANRKGLSDDKFYMKMAFDMSKGIVPDGYHKVLSTPPERRLTKNLPSLPANPG